MLACCGVFGGMQYVYVLGSGSHLDQGGMCALARVGTMLPFRHLGQTQPVGQQQMGQMGINCLFIGPVLSAGEKQHVRLMVAHPEGSTRPACSERFALLMQGFLNARHFREGWMPSSPPVNLTLAAVFRAGQTGRRHAAGFLDLVEQLPDVASQG